jgi:O-antigen ligase
VTNVRTVGSLFWVWLVAITFSQAFFNAALSPINRVGLVAIGVFAFSWALGVSIDWSSGWLPSLAALGIVCLFRFPRFTIGATLLLAAPAVMMSAAAWDSLMGNESWSWMTRVEAAEVMFEVVEANPWLGFGPANYRQYTKLFPILGYNLRFNSHNNYLDLLAQTGVVGLIAFGWFAFELFRLALALYRRVPQGFARAYVVGAIAGLTGSLLAGLLADWVVPFVYNIGLPGFRSSLLFWFFLGGLLAIKRIMASSHELRGAPARARGLDSRVGLRPAPMWARNTSTWSGFGD